MGVIFFWKCSKVNAAFENAQGNWEKVYCFWDKCIWIRCVELSLFRRVYLSSTVNVLTSSLKILHVTKRDLFKLNYLHKHRWIWSSCCRWHWNSVSARLPCCLSRDPLKPDFLDIYLITSFGVRNFGNI